MLYSKAREYVLSGGFGDVAGSKPVIYDLYTGTGTIAQMLSQLPARLSVLRLLL